MISRIHIIRHGITAGNLKNLMYSNTDLPLLKTGVEQIAELAALNAYPVPENAAYYTSGLLRTEQTLMLIYGEVEHETIWDLREMEFGKYENRTFEELNKDPEYVAWMSDETGEVPIPGGESINGFKRRVISGFEVVLAEHKARVKAVLKDSSDDDEKDRIDDERGCGDEERDCRDDDHGCRDDDHGNIDSIIICHGGPISAIMEYCFPDKKEHMFRWMPDPGHGYTIEYKDGEPIGQEGF
ncbi:MAG: histidine phosphatase family protein [Firmicutes bacterium]|nr:histidine phosphatase family protein [Bacillota bacterium]